MFVTGQGGTSTTGSCASSSSGGGAAACGRRSGTSGGGTGRTHKGGGPPATQAQPPPPALLPAPLAARAMSADQPQADMPNNGLQLRKYPSFDMYVHDYFVPKDLTVESVFFFSSLCSEILGNFFYFNKETPLLTFWAKAKLFRRQCSSVDCGIL